MKKLQAKVLIGFEDIEALTAWGFEERLSVDSIQAMLEDFSTREITFQELVDTIENCIVNEDND